MIEINFRKKVPTYNPFMGTVKDAIKRFIRNKSIEMLKKEYYLMTEQRSLVDLPNSEAVVVQAYRELIDERHGND